jgi:putative nucleotidyltransferase with HDIG domain
MRSEKRSSEKRSSERNGRKGPARDRALGRHGGKTRRLTAGRALRMAVFAAAVYSVMLMGHAPIGVQLGETSPRDYKARISFQSVDQEQTRASQERAMKREPPAFRAGPERWQASVQRLLDALRNGKADVFAPFLPGKAEREQFDALLPVLRKNVGALAQSLGGLAGELVVDPSELKQPIVADKETPGAVLLSPSGERQNVRLASFVPLSADSPALRAALAPGLEDLQPPQAALAGRVMVGFLAPGAVLDMALSRDAADRAAEAVPPITKYVEKGRIILARDSDVTSQNLKDLRRENNTYWESPEGRSVRLQHAAGLGVLLVIVLAAAIVPCLRYRPGLLDNRLQVLSFGVLSLALVATARVCIIRGVTPLWVPLPMMVMIMCLVFDQRFGLGAAVFYALLLRLAMPGEEMAFLVLLLGGLAAALLTGRVRTRATLVKAAVLIGLVQFVAVWGVALVSVHAEEVLSWQFWGSPYAGQSLAALANGVLGGFLVSGLLPAIETIFGVTTDIRLLEWSDPNQPLLQRLLLDAPGTYHHSMIVGSLAADAAEAIGANPLLARVSAYFHDVGKLKKPEYFAENIPAGAHNPHDDLSPTMSTLIITAHPKDGAEMADEYGVPAPVRDVILQSHGTGVLKFFLNKAQSAESETEEAHERDFRYRLLKPRSREAAVVMVCDAVESAARSMGSPSAGQLRNLVHQIILDRLHDGQLDESGLTITDLKRLEDTLVHGLGAVFHNRVRYPGQEKLERAAPEPVAVTQAGALSQEPTGAGGDQQPPEGR